MSRSPRCHKVQGHTANPSQGRAYSQDSGSRPGARRPPPPGMTEPERPLTAGGCRPRSLRRARGAAPRRAQNRSCCLVSRATHAGHFRCRAHRGQSARAALAGGTGGQRAHDPMPVPAFPSAVLDLIQPIFARPGRSGRLAGMSQCSARNPLCPLTTDAQGPPGFLDRPRECTSAPQQPFCATLTFPWAGKPEAPPRFPRGRVVQPRLCLTSRFPRVCQPRLLDLGCACHLLGARGGGLL